MERSPILRYAVAVLSVTAALLLRFLLNPFLGTDVPFITFFLPIMFAAWYGGIGPGIAATIASALLSQYFFVPPTFTLGINQSNWVQLSLFTIEGIAISLITWQWVHARSMVEEQTRQAVVSRRETEQKDARLRVVIDTSLDAIITMDETGRIIDWNPQAATLFGWTSAEAIGGRLSDTIIPERLRVSHEQGLSHFLKTGEGPVLNRRIEQVARHRNGHEFPVELTVTPSKWEGQWMFVASLRDISDRKAAQEQLLLVAQHEKDARALAEESNRQKDEFLAVLSHELRTPLNAVYGWSQLLQDGKLTAAKTLEALSVIRKNSKAQVQLIDDMLDVSRIVTGKMRLDVRPVQPIEAISAALDTVRPAAEAKGIRIQPVLDPNAGPVSGDSERLQQVIWNILSNAVKFTPKGGRVQVHLQRINSHVEIVVSDTGRGVPSDFLPYIFDRFRQADASSTRNQGGLGLGMSIVKHLVELHGGTVKVESPGEGHGTTVTVVLPVLAVRDGEMSKIDRVHPKIQMTSRTSLDDLPSLEGVKVLIVDDDAETLEILSAIFQRCGAEVKLSLSAREGLEILNGWRPALIVSDIGMPEEDGYAFIRRVRQWEGPSDNRIAAIALTAYARSEDRIRALSSGFQAHVAKPVEAEELIAVAASLISHTRRA